MGTEKLIPYKVSVMLPTVESWSKLGSSDFVVVLPSDSLKWSKTREKNRYTELFMKGKKEIKYEKVDLLNSGFSIELLPDYSDPYYNYYVKSWTLSSLVILKHPDFERYPFKIVTYVESKNLITLLSKSRSMINGVLSGEYCVSHVAGISGILYTVFEIEDPENKKLEDKKELGKKLSNESRTTKWKVGYSYLLKNESSFIYLGELKDWHKVHYRGGSLGNPISVGFSSYQESVENISLILSLDNLSNDEKSLLDSGKSGYISTFIVSYLALAHTNSYYSSFYHIRTLTKSSHPGVELEKVFEADDTDLGKLITGFFTSRYPNIKEEFKTLIDRDMLEEDKRKTLDTEFKRNIASYVADMFKYNSYSYRGHSKLDKATANDPTKFIAWLKSNKPSNKYYYGPTIFGILSYLGEVEFKNLLEGCTF